MPAPFPLELVSPERVLFSGEVEQVVVPAGEGEATILAHHAPFMSSLRPGVVTISAPGGSVERLFVQGGFCDVSPAGLILLAEKAVLLSEVNIEALAADVRSLEEDVRDAKSDEARAAAEEKLSGLRALLVAVRN